MHGKLHLSNVKLPQFNACCELLANLSCVVSTVKQESYFRVHFKPSFLCEKHGAFHFRRLLDGPKPLPIRSSQAFCVNVRWQSKITFYTKCMMLFMVKRNKAELKKQLLNAISSTALSLNFTVTVIVSKPKFSRSTFFT